MWTKYTRKEQLTLPNVVQSKAISDLQLRRLLYKKVMYEKLFHNLFVLTNTWQALNKMMLSLMISIKARLLSRFFVPFSLIMYINYSES